MRRSGLRCGSASTPRDGVALGNQDHRHVAGGRDERAERAPVTIGATACRWLASLDSDGLPDQQRAQSLLRAQAGGKLGFAARAADFWRVYGVETDALAAGQADRIPVYDVDARAVDRLGGGWSGEGEEQQGEGEAGQSERAL
jgi:hypothetical protein